MRWLWLNLQVLVFELINRAADLVLLAADPTLLKAYLRLWGAELRRSPYRRPRSFRTRLSLQQAGLAEDELVYGETPVWTAWRFFRRAGLQAGERVVDLGAGRGRPLLAARRLGAQALGLELLEDHVVPARRALEGAGIRLEQGDLTHGPPPVGELFLLNWSGLTPARREAVTRTLEQLPVGTRFVCVAAPLESERVQTLSTGWGLFTWGFERVWFQTRAALADTSTRA